MNDFFEVSKKDVILSRCTQPPLGEIEFIVYKKENGKNPGIHVNTYFIEEKSDTYNCCCYYDRKLCNTIEELKNMTNDEINSQAYGSWMDGAR